MSSPLRYVYRGSATSYNYNYGSELLANKGGFELLPPDDQVFGCPFPVGCPTNSGEPNQVLVGDVLSAVVYCNFFKIEWFNTSSSVVISTSTSYTVQTSDINSNIYYVVTYFDGSTDTSSLSCFPPVSAVSLRFWFQTLFSLTSNTTSFVYSSVVDNFGDMYFPVIGGTSVFDYTTVYKISNDVSEVWKVAYPQDPSLSSTILNRYGESLYALDSGEDSIDFISWQWSTGARPTTNWPVRIYRYRISKSTGSVQDIVAVDFNPTSIATTLSDFFYINTVLMDSDNNYYFVGYFPNSISLSRGASIIKLSENLTFLWCRDINSIFYRTNINPSFCDLGTSSGDVRLNIDKKDEIIGCAWGNSSTDAHLNYFCIQLDGTVTDRFRSKFKTPSFNTDTDPFKVRAVCKDTDGSVYGVGSYGTVTQTGTGSDIIVFKDDKNDNTVWATNIRNTFFNDSVIPTRISLNVLQNQLIIIDSKLVLVAPWSKATSPSTTYSILIFIFNLDTGVIEKAVDINAPTDTGPRLIVQKLYEKNKIVVSTNNGYRVRLNISDLPAAGDYICVDDITKKYTASGLVPSQSDVVFYRFDSCGPDSAGPITARDLSSDFSPASFSPTISGVQGNIFRYFAGQDTP
jgi:hypothetical protein